MLQDRKEGKLQKCREDYCRRQAQALLVNEEPQPTIPLTAKGETPCFLLATIPPTAKGETPYFLSVLLYKTF